MVLKSPASPFYSPRGTTSSTPSHNASYALTNIPILATAFLAILATGGPTYSFGVYAATLKHSLGLSQSQLETLGSASFAAGLISWIPGLAVDAWGSRSALMLGGFGQSCGLFLYWLVAKWVYVILPGWTILPTLSALSVLIFTSNNLVIGGVFKAIVVTCGLGTKGKAVGAAKAYLGLGAGVFSSLFRALPDALTGNDLDFLAMSSLCALAAIVLPAAVGLPTLSQMDKKGTKDESTDQHYSVVYAGLFALALVVVGTSAMDLFSFQANISLPEWLHGVLILAVWMGPIGALFLLPTQTELRRKVLQRQQSALRRRVRQTMEERPNEQMRLLPTVTSGTQLNNSITDNDKNSLTISWRDTDTASWRDNDPCSTRSDIQEEPPQETPQPIEDLTLPQMLQTLPAWLFLSAATILVGSGTMLTINMGQMVQSRRFPPETAAACLSMFSVAQALARVTSGALSESALQWHSWTCFGIRGVPRPAFLVVSCAFAVVGHALLAECSSSLQWFVLGIVFTGISFGALWPLMVLIVGDLFGTVNHGANYMFADGFTCAIGTLSIAKYLTQFVYEQHLINTEDADLPTACYGDECFRITHRIIAALCLVSLLACTTLLYMTRSSYGSLL